MPFDLKQVFFRCHVPDRFWHMIVYGANAGPGLDGESRRAQPFMHLGRVQRPGWRQGILAVFKLLLASQPEIPVHQVAPDQGIPVVEQDGEPATWPSQGRQDSQYFTRLFQPFEYCVQQYQIDGFIQVFRQGLDWAMEKPDVSVRGGSGIFFPRQCQHVS